MTIDLTRGFIVGLMALDHVRIFFSAAQFDPVDVAATTPGFFLTRWITHLCAPGFFFIAGLGAGLLESRSGKQATSMFLITRGIWLIALEFLVFGLAWSFNPGWFWFGVIWSLGTSMLILGVALWIGAPAILATGLIFTSMHNLVWNSGWSSDAPLATLFYTGGLLQTNLLGLRLVLFPVLPWLALMMIGYGATRWLARDTRIHVGRAAAAGSASIAVFCILRLMSFGEPVGGSYLAQADTQAKILSFLNVEKYPPSLQFSAITVGLLLLFSAAVERHPHWARNVIGKTVHSFGRVPFFFYLLHLFVIHGLALAMASLIGWPMSYLFWEGAFPNLLPPEGYGLPLLGIYGMWVIVLALMYPLCIWFGEIKGRSNSPLLRYL